MKSILSVVVAVLLAQISYAANVKWNSIEITSPFSGGYSISYPYLTMTGTVAGDVLTLWADAYDYMELSSSWTRAEFGDVMTVNSVKYASSYFYSADFWTGDESNVHTDYPITIKEGRSAYLAIISRTYTDPTDYDTAWIELRYDKGNLYVNSSAIDYDGGSLVIGAIPEPTTALLLLLGCAGLLLRRGRPRECSSARRPLVCNVGEIKNKWACAR